MSLSANTYFKVITKTEFEDAKGKIKKRRDEYIVTGISPTDVEAKITKELSGYDFEIVQIAQTKIVDIIE